MGYWESLLHDINAGTTTVPGAMETTHLKVVPGTLSWETGVVRRRWAIGPWAHNANGTVFGGLLAAAADQVTSLAAFTILGDDEASRTASLQVDYFRPVVGDYIDIEARVVNRSRRLIHTETELTRADGKIGAHARAVLAIVPFDRPGVG